MRNTAGAIAALGMVVSLAIHTPASAQEAYLGEIKLVGFNFCPRGTMPADGQLLPISQYSALFSLYGTYYGGDGRTTFALPDLRGRVPVHAGQGPGLKPYREGQRGGSEFSRGVPNTAAAGDDVPVIGPDAIPNTQPYLALRYCVVTQGVYPSRN